jgi:hypothetical protein
MSAFFGDLVVKLVNDEEGGLWELVRPISFESSTGYLITAPIGFRSDFMTIPRIPIVFDHLGDRCMRAGVLHDYAYSSMCVPREDADKLLQEMLIKEGMSRADADLCYLGVRICGESHYGTR